MFWKYGKTFTKQNQFSLVQNSITLKINPWSELGLEVGFLVDFGWSRILSLLTTITQAPWEAIPIRVNQLI